jgi:hypothetical protein
MNDKIHPETLKDWLDDPKVFVMDVRNPSAWNESTAKIKHARRFDPTQFSAWVNEVPRSRKLVPY